MNIVDTVQELAKSQAIQTEILGRLEHAIGEVNRHLLGDPNGRPGLITRVDRLEVWDKMKNKVLWLFGGTIVGCAASWLSGKF